MTSVNTTIMTLVTSENVTSDLIYGDGVTSDPTVSENVTYSDLDNSTLAGVLMNVTTTEGRSNYQVKNINHI